MPTALMASTPTTGTRVPSRATARSPRVTRAKAPAAPKRTRKRQPTDDDEAPLARYREKRDFNVTAEPGPVRARTTDVGSFVIQKHDATRLHYDFRPLGMVPSKPP